MKNTNKNRVFLLSAIFGVMVLISFIVGVFQLPDASLAEISSDDGCNNLHLSGDEIDSEDNSTWGYYEWREFIIKDRFNITEAELDPTISEDETFQHNLHILTIMSWGYQNGSLTEDDISGLQEQLIHNTVQIINIAIPVTTDESMNIQFDLFIDDDILFFYSVNMITIAFKSTDPNGNWYAILPTPVHVLITHLRDWNPIPLLPTIYPFSIWIPTYSLENFLKVFISAVGTISLILPPIPLAVQQRTVHLVDDDTTKPGAILLEPPLSPDYPTVKPVIYDSDPFLFIKLLCADQSGIHSIIATLSYDGVTQYAFGIWIGLFTYVIYVPNPRKPGEYSVDIDVYDADLDRGAIDQEIASGTLLFDVIDDDDDAPIVELDTGPPPYNSYFDGIKYTIPFDIGATDHGSGIYRITYKMGTHHVTKYYSAQGYPTQANLHVELELPPGMYLLEVWVEDVDNDRPNDRLITYLNRTIDLLAPYSFLEISDPQYEGYIVVDNELYPILFISSLTYLSFDVYDASWGLLEAAGVNKTYYRLDDEELYTEYENTPFHLTQYSHGIHTIHFYSDDQVGNVEYVEKSFEFYLDKYEPTTHVHFTQPNYRISQYFTYITSTTEISFFRGDSGSGVDRTIYRIDGGVMNEYTKPFILTEYTEGQHTIYFSTIDNVWNSDSNTQTVFIDDTPPITQAIIGTPKYVDGEGNIFINGDTQITLIAPDFGSGTKYTYYKIDGGAYSTYTGPITLASYLDGSHTIEFCSVDQLGNEETTPGTVTVILDTTPPETYIGFGDPYYGDGIGNHYLTSTTEIYLTSSDFDGSGTESMHYRIDGGAYSTYTGPITLASYLDGSHTIEFCSVDQLGNEETTPGTVTVILDTTPPETYIGFGDPYYDDGTGNHYLTSTTEIYLTSSDFDGSGTESMHYRIDGGAYSTYTGPITLASYLDGSHTIEFCSVDQLGNEETTPGTVTVILDTTPPETYIGFGDPYYDDGTGNHYLTSTTEIYLTNSDFDGSGTESMHYRIDGGAFIQYSEPLMLQGFAEGEHTIEFYSIDNLGNTEDPAKLRLVIMDETPPETEILVDQYYNDATGNIFITYNTKFSLIGEDLDSGVAKSFYQIDNGAFIEYFEPFTLQGFAEGEHIINFYSVDNVNNEESPPKSITINVVSLEVNTFISDGELNLLSHFDVIFAKDKLDGITGYRLVATNPGQFFYHIEVENTWFINIDCLIVDVILPIEFETQGTNPIIIYLDGVEITSECLISNTQVSIFDISPESKVEIVVHMDYALKGNFYESIDEFLLIPYDFNVLIQSSGVNPLDPSKIVSGTNFDQTELFAHQKKTTALAGYVYDSDGNPIVGVTVQLKISDLIIAETTTDENGLYWFLELESGDIEIRLIKNNIPISPWQSLTIIKNIMNWLNFINI